MNNGWVKLHRQVLNNEIFRYDPTAWRVFEVLLLLIDKNTAEWSGGLYQLSGFTGIKKDALYKAVKRLENAKMVTRRVNSKYTVYHICKWADFQGSETNSVNAEYTESKTKVKHEYNSNKNKEVRIKNKEDTSSSGEPELVHSFICELFKKNPERYKLSHQRKQKLQLRLKELGKDDVMNAYRAVAVSRFHRGENDRGWKIDTDPYWLLSSYEKTELWSNKFGTPENVTDQIGDGAIDIKSLNLGAM